MSKNFIVKMCAHTARFCHLKKPGNSVPSNDASVAIRCCQCFAHCDIARGGVRRIRVRHGRAGDANPTAGSGSGTPVGLSRDAASGIRATISRFALGSWPSLMQIAFMREETFWLWTCDASRSDDVHVGILGLLVDWKVILCFDWCCCWSMKKFN